MAINMNWKNLTILVSCAVMVASCKNGKLFGGKKKEKSDVTGWNYNDKNMGGYQVSKKEARNWSWTWCLFRVVPSPWVQPKKM